MSGAVQQQEVIAEVMYQTTGTESAAALRQVVSERLEAHRRRRAEAGGTSRAAEAEVVAPPRRASSAGSSASAKVREAVAARYRNSVTYREFLAQEAERALEQAEAEAEVATRKAQAVAEAQMQLLEELAQWDQPDPGPRELAMAEHKAEARETLANAMADIAVAAKALMELSPAIPLEAANFAAGLSVRMYEDLHAIRPPREQTRRVMTAVEHEAQEHEALDAEIAFRRAPEFEPHAVQPVGINGNLIEFPRQLVAARKARPRLAEGPLREESAPEPQLRIFEVEPDLISTAPMEPSGAPEWQGILLESAPKPQVHVDEQFHSTLQPQPARLELRLMAAAVDACCVGGGLLGFAVVVAEISGAALRSLPLPLLGASAAGVACGLFVMYQLLFFTLNDTTPGMRYARIGLCTFGDGNPTRPALRRRVLATLLAACPLGVGLAWAWLDEDSLGWHDRISRMYQRAY